MELIKIPKHVVINAGYISAVLIFLGIAVISVAVFMPKIVKPVYTPPVPKLEAKASYATYTYVGSDWGINVTLYEDSKATANNVVVQLSSPAFGQVSKTDDLIMPYTPDKFNFRIHIPSTTPPGMYNVTLTVSSKESTPSTSVINLQVFSPRGSNSTNNSSVGSQNTSS